MTPKFGEVAERKGVPVGEMVGMVVIVFEDNQFSFEIVTAVDERTHSVRKLLGSTTRTHDNQSDRYF